ncbi:hypothetical protein E2320_007322 [Naja naja]|nr:hypothetical protein E2320_007322 [Naja naja]
MEREAENPNGEDTLVSPATSLFREDGTTGYVSSRRRRAFKDHKRLDNKAPEICIEFTSQRKGDPERN